MIKVSVMYPYQAGARFDHAYYRDKHMPLVAARMGANLKSYTVDKGLAGGTQFESAEAALSGQRPLLVSQLAFPDAECRAIYRDDARYGESLRNLERQPISRDFVFADTGAAGQIVAMRGDPNRGYSGTATVAVG